MKKSIKLTAIEYIEFCAYYNNLHLPVEQIQTEYIKNGAIITASDEFLTKLGY